MGMGVLTIALLVLFGAFSGNQNQDRLLGVIGGTEYYLEGYSYGTNHAIGRDHWWYSAVSRVLPSSLLRFIPPVRGRGQMTCNPSSLVLWIVARDAKTGKYADPKGLNVSIIDDHGRVYEPMSYGSGGGSLFMRGHIAFFSFPRLETELKLKLPDSAGRKPNIVKLKNPAPPELGPEWNPVALPAVCETNGIRIELERVEVMTNGGPKARWEPVGRNWKPVFKYTQNGQPLTGWNLLNWDAADPCGNHGQYLGLYQPLLKFAAIAEPQPEAVSLDSPASWKLPNVQLPAGTNSVQWRTNGSLAGVDMHVFGLYPPGKYCFCDGEPTDTPLSRLSIREHWTLEYEELPSGRPRVWHGYSNSSNYLAFIRFKQPSFEQSLVAAWEDSQGQVTWAYPEIVDGNYHLLAPSRDFRIGVIKFDPPAGVDRVTLRLVMLVTARAEFVVKTPPPP